MANAILQRETSRVLKGVAIAMVLICHFVGRYCHGIRLFTPLGGIGVAIFLLLSGYGLNLTWGRNGWLQWWWKRINTVIIPYAIVQLFCYWPWWTFRPLSFLADVSCLRPLYHHGWYLQYLLYCYVWFFVAKAICRGRRRLETTVLAVGVLLTFCCGSELQGEQALSFLVGVALSQYKDKFKYNALFAGGIMVGVFALALKQLPLVREAPYHVFLSIQLLIKFGCALGIVIWAASWSLKSRVAGWLGGISYESYLIHGYFLDNLPSPSYGHLPRLRSHCLQPLFCIRYCNTVAN